MLLNEPTAALRVVSVRLLATGGAGLSPGHSWAPGEVPSYGDRDLWAARSWPRSTHRSRSPAARMARSTCSSTWPRSRPRASAACSSRPAGGQFAELTYEVRAHALEIVLDPLVVAGKGRTARECINIAAAYAGGDARGLDGPVGSIDSLAEDPAQRVKRVEFTVQSGKRTITARRG